MSVLDCCYMREFLLSSSPCPGRCVPECAKLSPTYSKTGFCSVSLKFCSVGLRISALSASGSWSDSALATAKANCVKAWRDGALAEGRLSDPTASPKVPCRSFPTRTENDLEARPLWTKIGQFIGIFTEKDGFQHWNTRIANNALRRRRLYGCAYFGGCNP